MIYSGLEVVRHRHNGRTAEVPEHINVDMDPVLHIHSQVSLCVSIHAERKNSNTQIHRKRFFGIPVYEVQFVSGPVHLKSATGPSGDVHGCTLFLCVLLEVIAELRVHEWLFAQLAALLTVLHLEQLGRHSAPDQLFGYLLKVRHPAQGYLLLFL